MWTWSFWTYVHSLRLGSILRPVICLHPLLSWIVGNIVQVEPQPSVLSGRLLYHTEKEVMLLLQAGQQKKNITRHFRTYTNKYTLATKKILFELGILDWCFPILSFAPYLKNAALAESEGMLMSYSASTRAGTWQILLARPKGLH